MTTDVGHWPVAYIVTTARAGGFLTHSGPCGPQRGARLRAKLIGEMPPLPDKLRAGVRTVRLIVKGVLNMGGGALAIPVLRLTFGIVVFFSALAFLLLQAPTVDQRKETPSGPQPNTLGCGGFFSTLIAAVGIGVLWFFVWKAVAMALELVFAGRPTYPSHPFPVEQLSFAISIVAMCVLILLARHLNSRQGH